jgi:hypothetical protein
VSDQQVHNVSYTRLSKSVSLSENYMVKNKWWSLSSAFKSIKMFGGNEARLQ